MRHANFVLKLELDATGVASKAKFNTEKAETKPEMIGGSTMSELTNRITPTQAVTRRPPGGDGAPG